MKNNIMVVKTINTDVFEMQCNTRSDMPVSRSGRKEEKETF